MKTGDLEGVRIFSEKFSPEVRGLGTDTVLGVVSSWLMLFILWTDIISSGIKIADFFAKNLHI